MNRRGTIKAITAGAVAAVVAPVAAQAASTPDADLIAMADRYVALSAKYNAAYKVPGLTIEMEEAIDQQTAPIEAEMQGLLDRIARTPARTPEGVAAIARAAWAYSDPTDLDPENEALYLSDRLAARLMLDAQRLT
ncbi:hypothetical protein ACMS1Z_00245 [Acidiphilium multivorum]|uniref:hypothetical protein n=1 Tax=Acidiphilium multivorum TaxID=62140 RepID=UPI0039C982E0